MPKITILAHAGNTVYKSGYLTMVQPFGGKRLVWVTEHFTNDDDICYQQVVAYKAVEQ